MEDAAEALKMAFSVFAFIIALGLAFTTFNQSKTVSDIVISASDRTYVESYAEADIENTNGRQVGAETVIPNLYRYYKEKYSIDIVNNGNIEEVFDLETERLYNDRQLHPNDQYKNNTKYKYLFPKGILWIGSSTNIDAKLRVDSYVSSEIKKINNEDVRHHTNFDFDTLYNQSFSETQTGQKYSSIDPSDPNYDGTYFIVESGSTKINMTFTKIPE